MKKYFLFILLIIIFTTVFGISVVTAEDKKIELNEPCMPNGKWDYDCIEQLNKKCANLFEEKQNNCGKETEACFKSCPELEMVYDKTTQRWVIKGDDSCGDSCAEKDSFCSDNAIKAWRTCLKGESLLIEKIQSKKVELDFTPQVCSVAGNQSNNQILQTEETPNEDISIGDIEAKKYIASKELKKLRIEEKFLSEKYNTDSDEEKNITQKELGRVRADLKVAEENYKIIQNNYNIEIKKRADAILNKHLTDDIDIAQKASEEFDRQTEARKAEEARLRDRGKLTDFQTKQQSGDAPQYICFDSKCEANETKSEPKRCTYFSIDQNSNPKFYKSYPYALSDEDLSGLKKVFANTDLASLGPTMLLSPSKTDVIKFIVTRVTGIPIVSDLDSVLSLGPDILTEPILESIQDIQHKLDIVQEIEIPVKVTTIEINDIYTSKEAGACYSVKWDKETTTKVIDTKINSATFICGAYSSPTTFGQEGYDGSFNFENTAETVNLRQYCTPSKDTRAFAEKMSELSKEALRSTRDKLNISNSDQCPPQKL